MSGPLGAVSGNGLYGNPYAGGASGQQRLPSNPTQTTGPQFTSGSVGTADSPASGSVPGGQILTDKPGRGSNGLIPYARVVAGDFVTKSASGYATESNMRLRHATAGELVWVARCNPDGYSSTTFSGPDKMDTVATTEYVQDFYAGPRIAEKTGDALRHAGRKDTNLGPRLGDGKSPMAKKWIYSLTAMRGMPTDESVAGRIGDPPAGVFNNTYGPAYGNPASFDVRDPRAWGVGVAETRAPGRHVDKGAGFQGTGTDATYRYNLLNMYDGDDDAKYAGGGIVFSRNSAFIATTPLRNSECITDFDPKNPAFTRTLGAQARNVFDNSYRGASGKAKEPDRSTGMIGSLAPGTLYSLIQKHVYNASNRSMKDVAKELEDQFPIHASVAASFPTAIYNKVYSKQVTAGEESYVSTFMPNSTNFVPKGYEDPPFTAYTSNLFPSDDTNVMLQNALADPKHPLFRLNSAIALFQDTNVVNASEIEEFREDFLKWSRERMMYLLRVETTVLALLAERVDGQLGKIEQRVKSDGFAAFVSY